MDCIFYKDTYLHLYLLYNVCASDVALEATCSLPVIGFGSFFRSL